MKDHCWDHKSRCAVREGQVEGQVESQGQSGGQVEAKAKAKARAMAPSTASQSRCHKESTVQTYPSSSLNMIAFPTTKRSLNMIAFPTTIAFAFSGGFLCVFALDFAVGLSFVEPLVNIATGRLLPAAIRWWSFGMRWTSHTFTFFLVTR